jgi:chemotaxis protein methyltransferase CheR
MEKEVFNKLTGLIRQESGISLDNSDLNLLQNRLRKRLRVLGIENPREYLEIIETDASGEELRQFLDVVSTNVTFFNREPKHFEIFREQLKTIAKETTGPIKVWCAASSSGEEPYTLAMNAIEELGIKEASRVQILATDISMRVLKEALVREYELEQINKLPKEMLSRYFSVIEDQGTHYWRVKDEVATMVTFKRLNLSKFPYPLKGPMHFIFCRNVMIYFDKDLRTKIVHECERLLTPGGCLYLSHSENMLGIDHDLKTVATAVYRRG